MKKHKFYYEILFNTVEFGPLLEILKFLDYKNLIISRRISKNFLKTFGIIWRKYDILGEREQIFWGENCEERKSDNTNFWKILVENESFVNECNKNTMFFPDNTVGCNSLNVESLKLIFSKIIQLEKNKWRYLLHWCIWNENIKSSEFLINYKNFTIEKSTFLLAIELGLNIIKLLVKRVDKPPLCKKEIVSVILTCYEKKLNCNDMKDLLKLLLENNLISKKALFSELLHSYVDLDILEILFENNIFDLKIKKDCFRILYLILNSNKTEKLQNLLQYILKKPETQSLINDEIKALCNKIIKSYSYKDVSTLKRLLLIN